MSAGSAVRDVVSWSQVSRGSVDVQAAVSDVAVRSQVSWDSLNDWARHSGRGAGRLGLTGRAKAC